MFFVLSAHCADEYLEGFDVALVNIDKTKAKEILGMIASLNKLAPKPAAVEYYSDSVEFFRYSGISLDDSRTEDLSLQGVACCVENPCAAENESRVSCPRMVVVDDAVYWTCYPKHGDHEVETHAITVQQLEMVVKGTSTKKKSAA